MQNNGNFMDVLNMLRCGNNPQAMVQQLAMQNPQFGIVMSQLSQSGMSAKQYCMQYAKQNNIDINGIINMFQSQGIRL